MRYLVISDIHANIESLDAVLAAAGAWDQVLMLGDVVGYGASPNAVIERLMTLPSATMIRGNHDKVAAGLEEANSFNHLARQAIVWTAAELTPGNHAWLAALPRGPLTVEGDIEICHGSPVDEDAYVFDDLDATRALKAASAPVCLFGHTHVPAAYRMHAGLDILEPPHGETHTLRLDAGRYLVNCGAVGQPRDADPRAAFGELDTTARTLKVRRVVYDVEAARNRILEAGLPEVLGQRLIVGR